jgi:hypothetical protein
VKGKKAGLGQNDPSLSAAVCRKNQSFTGRTWMALMISSTGSPVFKSRSLTDSDVNTDAIS